MVSVRARQSVSCRLVDFGLSCRIDDDNAHDLQLNDGAQVEGVGPRIERFLEMKKPIIWTVGDDYEMLGTMLMNTRDATVKRDIREMVSKNDSEKASRETYSRPSR